MTLSLQDRRLIRAHDAFVREADAVGPLLLLAGMLRGTAAVLRTAVAARSLPDPMALTPRVLQD